MGEVVFKYDSPSSDILPQTPLSLTCICEDNAFSYVVDSVSDQDVLHMRSVTFDRKFPLFAEPLGFLEEVMREDEVLFNRFERKALFVRGVPFSITSISDTRDRKGLLNGIADVGPNDKVYTDSLVQPGLAVHYVLPHLFVQEVAYYFRNATVRHAMSGLLCKLTQGAETTFRCLANISSQWLELVVYRRGQIEFANHYRCRDTADIIYYMAAVFEQLGAAVPHLMLSGPKCDRELTGEIAHAFALNDTDYELLPEPRNRLIDLTSIAGCE